MENIKNQRTRSWTFVVYPESAPKNWEEIIQKYILKL